MAIANFFEKKSCRKDFEFQIGYIPSWNMCTYSSGEHFPKGEVKVLIFNCVTLEKKTFLILVL